MRTDGSQAVVRIHHDVDKGVHHAVEEGCGLWQKTIRYKVERMERIIQGLIVSELRIRTGTRVRDNRVTVE